MSDDLYEEHKKYLKSMVQEVYRVIAQRDNITEEEVIQRIQKKILWGFNNEDPEIQKKWMMIPHFDEIPTPEEYVIHLILTYS